MNLNHDKNIDSSLLKIPSPSFRVGLGATGIGRELEASMTRSHVAQWAASYYGGTANGTGTGDSDSVTSYYGP
jgi:hypothetical protein